MFPNGKIRTPEPKTHLCPFPNCGQTFNRPYRLAQHLLVHNNIRAYICQDPTCGKSYTTKSHLDRHINNSHKQRENVILYSCPQCFKRYANRQNLKRHIEIHHNLRPPLACDVCKMEFRKKNQLTAHMYVHTGIKAFGNTTSFDSSCDICSEDFVTLYEKRRHMRVHRTYQCDDCLMQFNLWSAYQKHKKIEHAVDEYHCNDCGRVFKQRQHIVRHVKIHDPAYPFRKIFPCPYENCPRYYTRNSNLRQHIIINHIKLTHGCTICGAQLSTKAKLTNHIKLHEKPSERAPPKTKLTGRKERKDKGTMRMSTALKLAGILKAPDATSEPNPSKFLEICISPT